MQFAEIYPLLEKNIPLPKNFHQDISIDSEDDDEREETEDKNISETQYTNFGNIKDISKLFSLNNLKIEFPNLHAILKISL